MGICSLQKISNVVILDLRKWLGRNVTGLELIENERVTIKQIGNLFDLKKYLEENSALVAIDFIGITEISHLIRTEMQKCKIPVVLVERGALPKPLLSDRLSLIFRQFRSSNHFNHVNNGSSNKVISKVPKFSIKERIRLKISHRREVRLEKLVPADISFVSGKKALNNYTKNAKRKMFVPSRDRIIFESREENESRNILKETMDGYILFIDDDIAHAQDWTTLGIPSPVDEKEHFSLLNDFFTRIESITNKPIVIASHPGREMETTSQNLYEGRKIIYRQTANLVANSEFTITFASTAISFAVLAKKPIIFLTSDKIQLHSYSLLIKSMCKSLRSKIVNIDRDVDFNPKEIEINIKSYNRYESNFIGKPSKRDPWLELMEIIINKKN
jgi:hypothetical protein